MWKKYNNSLKNNKNKPDCLDTVQLNCFDAPGKTGQGQIINYPVSAWMSLPKGKTPKYHNHI